MSGVYIKGMEMPERCFACPMCEVYDAEVNCAISHGSYKEYRDVDEQTAINGRPDWCPLAPVPPHGRLIDADALTIILSKVIDINASIEQRNEATDQERRCLWWFEQQIGIAPTIIEAEGGDAQ